MFKQVILLSALFLVFTSGMVRTDVKLNNTSEDLPFYEWEYEWADSILNQMTTEEKIGQLLMVSAYSRLGSKEETRMKKLINNYHIGGVIFMQGHPSTQARMCNALQASSKYPLLIGQDAEWGLSMRLDSTIKFPRQMLLGAISEDEALEAMGSAIGKELKRLGVHLNFAPVVDVNNNAANPVINDRSFGENRENVMNKGIAYMKGLQNEKILACAKHFPGHGDTDTDSHLDLPVINHNKQRLDSIELYPFKGLIEAGVSSIMTAHLSVPAYEKRKNRASSLSESIIRNLLQTKLRFRGLVISDALNMKGVSKYFKPGQTEVQAFLAGNDILLFPADVPTAVAALKQAVSDGTIPLQVLDTRVKKILKAKYWVGLADYKPVVLDELVDDINEPATEWLKQNLIEHSLTMVYNDEQVIPVMGTDTISLATLEVDGNTLNSFSSMVDRFTRADHYTISKSADTRTWNTQIERLAKYDLVLISVHGIKKSRSRYGLNASLTEQLKNLDKKTKTAYVLFGNPYALKYLGKKKNILVGYEDNADTRAAAAAAIFGAIAVNGQLPITASGDYRYGMGISQNNKIRLHYTYPEAVGLNSEDFKEIDRLAYEAINAGAVPGCQVMVVKGNNVIYNKNFGHHTYERTRAVIENDLYDLASITKVAATTMAMMKLEEEGKIDLDDQVGDHLENARSYAYRTAKIRDLLTHRAGLTPWIPFYTYALKADDSTAMFADVKTDSFCIPVADGLYMCTVFQDSMWRRIGEAPLKGPSYRYSDLSMIIAKEIIEKITGIPLNEFVEDKYYQPLGLNTMTYNPYEKFNINRIPPTEKDNYFRNQIVQGYVHDMGAAMFGGVSGHAGLFSNANDLAVLFRMLLNGGTYAGKRYLQKTTIKRWTSKQNEDSRRGLGFDKPDHGATNGGPTAKGCSTATFGHTGFTGTCVWADPVHDVIFIFLSNRTYPTMENRKLIRMNTRTLMQQVVYDALEKKYAISETE